ncbi:hypothetical protein [Spongiactinospora sp. TRM90649]|uniref:hypothetical protein n=1 Tax=Spongiactinospora sp. TRM90649 TaxID=3031114 RepID=UPI0023F8F3DF|nr:hypothetical protein [Spongiactinospora sp. TRM90649]MDF5754288.1 hypothetical protein [Spongiactinospora sp. TRM90649]
MPLTLSSPRRDPVGTMVPGQDDGPLAVPAGSGSGWPRRTAPRVTTAPVALIVRAVCMDRRAAAEVSLRSSPVQWRTMPI